MHSFLKYIAGVSAVLVLFSGMISSATAQTAVPPGEGAELQVPPQDEGTEQYHRARVKEVISENDSPVGGMQQQLLVELLSGEEEGREIETQYIASSDEQALAPGDTVVAISLETVSGLKYWISDHYRLPSLGMLGVAFVALTVLFAGVRGLTSLFGMAVSILVLALFVVPRIMAGQNPIVISLVGALLIATISIYLAHGFKRRTSIALISTLITISGAVGVATLSIRFGKLFGLGTEEAFFLQVAQLEPFDVRGLLLGGIIIGALGVLDDITTSQAAAVDEIHRANPKLPFSELMQRGLSVGREHITSLVNTLVLAYAGASLPLLLLFTIYERPWWVVLNSERVAEEVIRTFVGSSALIVAVPITTFLAAYVITKWPLSQNEVESSPPSHYH